MALVLESAVVPYEWQRREEEREEEREEDLIPDSIQWKLFLSSLFQSNDCCFFAVCWEQFPCLFHTHSSLAISPFPSLFSRDYLLSLCQSPISSSLSSSLSLDSIPSPLPLSPLRYHQNMNIVKYSQSKRIAHDLITREEYASKDSIQRSFHDGYTVQFFQPQRFSNSLFFLCSEFEKLFGTLAGASAYLTPANTQGLAPHWDDVEVFIFQTEGTKQWNLWKPSSIPLPETYSHDIPRCTLPSIPHHQLTLHPGDILYLPRGTIHEAIALDTFSTHITISVYQKYHIKSLVQHIFPVLLEKFFEKTPNNTQEIPEIRKGLPLQLLSKFGTHVAERIQLTSKVFPSEIESTFVSLNDPTTSCSLNQVRDQFKNKLKSVLTEMIESLEHSDIDEGVDLIGDDFCANRLPDLEFSKKRKNQTVVWKDQVLYFQTFKSMDALIRKFTTAKKLRKSSGIFMKLCPPSWLHVRAQLIDGVNLLLIGSGRGNNRMNHMGHPSIETESIKKESDLDSSLDWVKLTLPIRYHPLLALFHVLNRDVDGKNDDQNWVNYRDYVKSCDSSFIEEEIFETIFGLFEQNLLEIAFNGAALESVTTSSSSATSHPKRKKLRQT